MSSAEVPCVKTLEVNDTFTYILFDSVLMFSLHVLYLEEHSMNAMFRQMIHCVSVVTLISIFSAGLVRAEDAPGTRIGVRGEITGVSPDVLKVHANSGDNVVINLTRDTRGRAVTLANIEDIKPGSYIDSALFLRRMAPSRPWR